MNAPSRILMGEGQSPGAYHRITQLLSDPIASRLLSAAFAATQSDASIATLLAEAQGQGAWPADAHARWLSALGPQGTHLMGLSPSDVHVPSIMQNIFVVYQNRQLIADMVSPLVDATKLSDRVAQMPVATMQQVANTRIANSRARPNEVTYSTDNTLTYNCQPVGLIDFIPAETLANADANALRTRSLYMAIVKQFLDLAREVNVAAVAFAAASYGANTDALAGGDRWDQSTSDPIKQLLDYKERVFTDVNTLVLGGQVWPQLRSNPAVRQYILSRAGTGSGAIPMQVELATIAELLGLERVIVGRAKYLSTQEGAASPTYSYVWGKSAALVRVEPAPDPLMTQTFMYTYRFGGKAYRNEVIPDRLAGAMGGEYIKLSTFEDDIAIGGESCGFFIDTVIS